MKTRKDTRVLTKEKSMGYKYPESIKYWSDKNEDTPYDYFPRETTKVWWKCHNGIHEDYLRSCDASYAKHYQCPKCNIKKQQEGYKDRLKETFEDYCKTHDIPHLLELWDYELNDLLPSEIGPHSTKQKIYFKCPEGLHGSHSISLNNLCKTVDRAKRLDLLCPACKSFGQAVINEYGKDYLDKIWSDKNENSYYDFSRRSNKTIWLKCLNDDTHPDYDLPASAFILSHNCPYCAGKRICLTNSLGYKFPKAVEKWSDKNELTPFDYTPFTKEKVWFKCENNKHPDYPQVIANASGLYDFRCPECGRENQVHPSGPNAPGWKGGITPEVRRIRKSSKYAKWRTTVYQYDNYLCQCCLNPKNNRLRAHHIRSFSSHEELRFDVSNGITLCEYCHDAIKHGSFHNLYGTKDKTPDELQEYINNKRKQLGILIPFNIKDYIENKKTSHLSSWINKINNDPIDEDWEEELNYEPKEV